MLKSSIKNLARLVIPENKLHKLRHYKNKIRYFGFRFKRPICNSYLSKLDFFWPNTSRSD